MGFLSKLFGKEGTPPQENAPAKSAEALSDHDDDGFVDIDLAIIGTEYTNDGRLRVDARGVVGGEEVGVAVVLGKEWSPQAVDDTDLVMHWGRCTFHSLGAESDRFVALMAKRYGMAAPGPMLDAIDAPLVMLGTDPAQIDSMALRAKAFFHTDHDDESTPEDDLRYAEVFTNIDLPGGVLQIHEKDPGYRRALLRALTEA